MTIATASGEKNVRFFFEHLGLDRWFSLERVALNDGTMKGKPEPDIYWKAAELLGIRPEECVVFEDAKSGIEAACRAGAARVIGVESMQDRETLLAWGRVPYHKRLPGSGPAAEADGDLDGIRILDGIRENAAGQAMERIAAPDEKGRRIIFVE